MAEETNTQQVLQGTFYGYIKCTYTHICAKDRQLLFSFSWPQDYEARPIVYATNIQYNVERQEVYLTPYARQRFLDVLEDAGWCIDRDGKLAEIPVYENVQVYSEPRLELSASGQLVEVRDKIERTVRKKYSDARHNRMYAYAVRLLPYIENADTPVYVRSSAIRWDKHDLYGEEIAEQEAAEQAKQAAIAEAERLKQKAQKTKTLGILTAIATIFTTLK